MTHTGLEVHFFLCLISDSSRWMACRKTDIQDICFPRTRILKIWQFRDRLLITRSVCVCAMGGGGGLQHGKLARLKLFAPLSRQRKTCCGPLSKGWNFFASRSRPL